MEKGAEMTQLAIYIEDQLSEKLEKAVKSSGKSKSKWIADVIKKELNDQWPADFFNLAGSWKDDRGPDEIMKEIRKGSDIFEKREDMG
jgi:predicted DNA-binding protein